MQTGDMQKLDAYVKTVQNSIQAMQDEFDGRLARALTMLANSRDDLRAQIGTSSSAPVSPGPAEPELTCARLP
jgi:hypothetical protein